MDNIQEKARYLRNNMTDAEKRIWGIIRNRQFYGYRFLRQYVIDSYIVDFVCREKKIIIEIDGGQHNQSKDIEYDKTRTEHLQSKGYRVIRFWNNDVNQNLSGVYEKLKAEFNVN